MGRNLHQYYYKDYFGEKPEEILDPRDNQNRRRIHASLNWEDTKCKENPLILKERNKRLIERGLLKVIQNPVDTKDTFQLEIIYPGLVTGIGINHEATIEGEFKLGVHFDWTYGMPIIYGSSVKGVLRSWFTEFYEGDIDPIDLMMDIFEGVYDRDVKSEQEKYKENWAEKVKKAENRIYKSRKSIYKRDIFFDAVIVEADNKGRILVSDSITPHDKNPLKNPTPITFLKIAPGCKLEFRFKLHDSGFGDGKTLTALQKKTLFEEILKTIGIGAKTNVGYGQLK